LILNFLEVWLLDTGASYSGRLTLMNVETKEYFQSSIIKDLYPGIPNR